MADVLEAVRERQADKAIRAEQASGVLLDKPSPAEQPATPRAGSSSFAREVKGGDGYSRLLVAHHDRGGVITEGYRALRTSLLAQCVDKGFCYVITSAQPGEGKTVTCLNLALVLAEGGNRRTIVMDCDLRKSRAAALLNTGPSPGVADLLRETATLARAVHPTAYPNLFFIPAGQAGKDEVGELVARAQLTGIIDEVRRQYDYVLIDTPTVTAVSDAGMVGRSAREALLVVRMYRTPRDSVAKAIRLLKAANVGLAGTVLTHWKQHVPDYLLPYS